MLFNIQIPDEYWVIKLPHVPGLTVGLLAHTVVDEPYRMELRPLITPKTFYTTQHTR